MEVLPAWLQGAEQITRRLKILRSNVLCALKMVSDVKQLVCP